MSDIKVGDKVILNEENYSFMELREQVEPYIGAELKVMSIDNTYVDRELKVRSIDGLEFNVSLRWVTKVEEPEEHEFKVGDKVILHRDRIESFELEDVEPLLRLKDWVNACVAISKVCKGGGYIVSLNGCSSCWVSEDWVTKVEEPKEDIPDPTGLVDLEDSYIANQPDMEVKPVHSPELSEDVKRLMKSMHQEIERLTLSGTGSYRVWADNDGQIKTESVNPWDKVAAAVHEVDPNKEMIEADGLSPIAITQEAFSIFKDYRDPVTPIDAIELVGRALTKTAGFPEKLGCYEHIRGNMDD